METENSEITYQVWKVERRSERRIIVTSDINVAMETMEGLGGRAEFVYIYYFFLGKCHFLCCTLDNKYSRKDYRLAVRNLLRPKEKQFYFPRPGLWAGEKPLG
jgi:hypothetical protein